MPTRDPGRTPATPPASDSSPTAGGTARPESSDAPRRARRLGGDLPLPAPPPAGSPTPRLPGWVVERPLAAGAQADLYVVRPASDGASQRDERTFVAKVFRLRSFTGASWSADEQQWRMLRAVVALRLLETARPARVPRVVAFSTCLDGTDGERRAWYVMPYYAGGAMWRAEPGGGNGTAAGPWSESYRGNVDRVLEIAEALATTLAAMHDGPRRVVHRDVTAGNVFFTASGGAPVLGDFGIAHVAGFAERPAESARLDPLVWQPPELDAGGDGGSPAGDVFMLGGLVYQALSGGRLLPPTPEWDGVSIHARPAHTLRQDSDDPRMVGVEALLDRMLTRDGRDRLPAREVARVCRGLLTLPRERRGPEAR